MAGSTQSARCVGLPFAFGLFLCEQDARRLHLQATRQIFSCTELSELAVDGFAAGGADVVAAIGLGFIQLQVGALDGLAAQQRQAGHGREQQEGARGHGVLLVAGAAGLPVF